MRWMTTVMITKQNKNTKMFLKQQNQSVNTCFYITTVWVKNHPLRPAVFWHFHKWLRTLNQFLHTYCTFLLPIYDTLQNFIQLSQILTKLCHINRHYLVHIICSKCPPSAETHAFRRLRKSLIALLIVVCGNLASHPRSAAFIMSTNMLDMTWRQQWRHLLSKQT